MASITSSDWSTFEDVKEQHYQVVVSLQKTTNVTDHAGNPKVRTWTETYLVKAATPEMAAEHTKEMLLTDTYCYVVNPEYNESKFSAYDTTGTIVMNAWINGGYGSADDEKGTESLYGVYTTPSIGTTLLKSLLDTYGPYVDRFDRTTGANSYTVGSGEKHPIPIQATDGISIIQIKKSPIIGTFECEYDALIDHAHHSNHSTNDATDGVYSATSEQEADKTYITADQAKADAADDTIYGSEGE